MTHRSVTTLALVVVASAATACYPDNEPTAARGEVLFQDKCMPCHGAEGLGNATIAAPNIAGLPDWYVERQLHNFRSGTRAYHIDDAEGLRMRPMSRALHDDIEVQAVSAYVSGLPTHASVPTLGGDADKGKALFAACAACHGAEGKGNQELGAPPIAQMDDWYLESQLWKFKNKVRGSNPDDKMGATMAPMAATLTDEEKVKDVVAYIKTLGG